MPNPQWKAINNIQSLDDIMLNSNSKPILLFKHSNICPISDIALKKMEDQFDKLSASFDCYLIVVQEQRPISNEIAVKWNIEHQSPQALIIYNEKCIYDESHLHIEPKILLSQI